MSSIDDTNFGMLLLLSMLLRDKQALRLGLETHLFKLDTTDIIQYENAINYIIVFIPFSLNDLTWELALKTPN